jgi:hypothetical protein
MTTLEEMQQAWQQLDRKLEHAVRLNEQLLRVHSPLRRLVWRLGLEAGVGAAAVLCMGDFLARHAARPGLLWPGVALHLWLILFLANTIGQLVAARRIDFTGAVADVQRQLAALRVRKISALRWELLTGQLVWWIPFTILLLHAVGVNAYRVPGRTFLAVNLGLSVAIIPLSVWSAKLWGDRLSHTRFGRWLADQLAGHSLTEAQEYAAALSAFEHG